MIIGVPKEIKNNEGRVALTAAGAFELIRNGHKVLVEKNAGLGSGISDEDYLNAGASIIPNAASIWQDAEMIIKVKEPIEQELTLARKGQLIFTYFHFASSEVLTKAMIDAGSICIAYETVELENRTLPLLVPMSEVAGRMAAQQGAKFLEKPQGGKGILLGGVPGVHPGRVLVLGGGVVGTQAAKIAAGLGAQVTILDLSPQRLRQLDDILPANVVTEHSSSYRIRELVKTHDLIIGAVLVPGAKAPKLITKDMLKDMQEGTVIVDVAVDQGGCVETCRPTTHNDPTFVVDGVLHYCVANMPGAVPYTSTLALTNCTLPYILELANKGWQKACKDRKDLKKGLNIIDGKVVYKGVAEAFNLEYHDLDSFYEELKLSF